MFYVKSYNLSNIFTRTHVNIILAIPKKLNHNGYIYSISALLYSIHTSYITKPFKKKLYLEALEIQNCLDFLDYLDYLDYLD